jgi:hypothetical protein
LRPIISAACETKNKRMKIMDRRCEHCRHYHALLTCAELGTCHLRPPKQVDPALLNDLPDRQADEAEMARWPAVMSVDLCGKFGWKCQFHRCREQGFARTEQDRLDGAIYCHRHAFMRAHYRRPSAA